MICLGPQSVVVDFVSPFHNYDSPEASVYEGRSVLLNPEIESSQVSYTGEMSQKDIMNGIILISTNIDHVQFPDTMLCAILHCCGKLTNFDIADVLKKLP